ncbi:MAG: ABC transporter ATP-binding protein [Gammaproteobacteria bacterium]|nr:MAG: ABC transporter ATP-binding protein [Gammaproteobacteria bacterium]
MLEVRALDARYGRAHVLHGIELDVAAGEVVSLLGRNGAGKTTTLKAIMQLLPPAGGSIRFAGREIVGLAPWRVARLGIGYVPEERRIFSDLTILENLEVGRRALRSGEAEAFAAATTPGSGAPGAPAEWTIEALFELFPNLAERRHNRGKALSGGEQQMLSIARTLMGNPRLLLLDEPSEGIAPVIVEELAETLIRLKGEGLTVLLSEQNLHFARAVADRAVIIESGERKFAGSLAELAARPDIRDAFLAL